MQTDENHHDHSAHAAHDVDEQAASQHEHAMGPEPQAAHAAHEHAAHGVDHSGHEETFRRRFWVSLLLSIPVILYTPMLQEWFGIRMPSLPGGQWVPVAFAVAVFLYGGLPFLQMAVPEIRNRQPGMMLLISLAISVSFIYSTLAVIFSLGEGFFWELVTLIDIMLLGHWLEMRSVRQASGALDSLAKLMPDTAEHIMPDGSSHIMPVSALSAGNLVLVRPGASVPADGIVEEGESDVNEAMLTGESAPVTKAAGSKVIGGTLNGSGSLRVRVSATGEHTALAGIMRLVREAQQSKSRTQILADRAAGWLFYLALGVAFLTAVGWTLAAGLNLSTLERVVTVLVIACPHALGLAVPLVVAITTASAAQNGILVRDRLALENARQVDIVVFDKTGTLTEGMQGVAAMKSAGGNDEEALALAAAVEGDSEHAIAAAIRSAAEHKGLKLPAVTGFEASKGRGVHATLDGRDTWVGGPRMLESMQLRADAPLAEFAEAAGERGQSVVYLVQNGAVAAAFALADTIRPESHEAVKRLRTLGYEVAMLTGDSESVARSVSEQLGIYTYFAQVLPERKDQKISELQRGGKRVAMVGDGVNDAPALVRADIGIAMGGGTDVAIESAGIVLVRSNPLDVVNVFRLSRASYRKMIENLIWASGYNVVALPLAAGVLAWAGILLSPAAGAILMSLSTIIVALNAQTLRRLDLTN